MTQNLPSLSDFSPEGRITEQVLYLVDSSLNDFIKNVLPTTITKNSISSKVGVHIYRAVCLDMSTVTVCEQRAIDEIIQLMFKKYLPKETISVGMNPPEPSTTNGSENYGSWEIMEIIEKYANSPGEVLMLKNLLRKPKSHESRLKDLLKAQNYLNREISLIQGDLEIKIK